MPIPRGGRRTIAGLASFGPSSEGVVQGPARREDVALAAAGPQGAAAPTGNPASSEKVRVFAGRSGSVAVAVNVSNEPAVALWLPITARTGGRFTSLTVTVMVSESFVAGEPLSVTRTVML